MSILCHVSFTSDPINNPDREETLALSGVQGQSYTLKAVAEDSEDPSASFTYSWAILNTRTGQTASLLDSATDTPILQNINATWGNIRVFCIATNSATLETSESNPLLAPNVSFLTLKLTSNNRTLDLPALASRNWWSSLDYLFDVVENLQIETGLSSATINAGGELILTLSDNTQINVGVVVGATGPAGAAGADGAAGAAGTNGTTGTNGTNGTTGTNGVSVTGANVNSNGNLILTLSDSSTINAGSVTSSNINRYAYTVEKTHWHDLNQVNEGFDVTKIEVIAGPFVNHFHDIDVESIHVFVKDMGGAGNQVQFQLCTFPSNQWTSNSFTGVSSAFVSNITTTAGEGAIAQKFYGGQTVTSGTPFGLLMYPNLLHESNNANGRVDNLTINILCREV